MRRFIPEKLSDVGLETWLERKGIDFQEFCLYVDRGARPYRLLEIYRGKINNFRTIRSYLNQLAHERGFSDWHDLYV